MGEARKRLKTRRAQARNLKRKNDYKAKAKAPTEASGTAQARSLAPIRDRRREERAKPPAAKKKLKPHDGWPCPQCQKVNTDYTDRCLRPKCTGVRPEKSGTKLTLARPPSVQPAAHQEAPRLSVPHTTPPWLTTWYCRCKPPLNRRPDHQSYCLWCEAYRT